MRRFFAPAPQFTDREVRLDAEETRHLARVLRLGPGARVEVCDGRGRQVEAVVAAVEPEGARLKIVRELESWGESLLPLVLGVGLAKGDALDAVIRQATEMGVKEIIPFVSERSEQSDPARLERRLVRWRRLAQESLKSCQRSRLPRIDSPREFPEILAGPEEMKLMFWEEERAGGLKQWLGSPRPRGVRILIGPEGGFSPQEVELAREAGFKTASLGPRRLRVETAALAALALMEYAWGDLA